MDTSNSMYWRERMYLGYDLTERVRLVFNVRVWVAGIEFYEDAIWLTAGPFMVSIKRGK